MIWVTVWLIPLTFLGGDFDCYCEERSMKCVPCTHLFNACSIAFNTVSVDNRRFDDGIIMHPWLEYFITIIS